MTELKVVIVDDEAMARSALRRMLTEFPGIKICGEANSVDDAARIITQTQADAVYLDIELYGESGFDLLDQLDERITVVFVTAYSQYAIRAFDVDARDYLLKPVTKDRLAQTISRLQEQRSGIKPSSDGNKLNLDDSIPVQEGRKRSRIPLKQLCLIEAKGDYTVLTSVNGSSGIVWQSLNQWLRLLPAAQFIRIHRGVIVNLDQVKSFETVTGNRLKLNMNGIQTSCFASRRLTPYLRKRLLKSIQPVS